MLHRAGAIVGGYLVMMILGMVGTMTLSVMLVPRGLRAMREATAGGAPVSPPSSYLTGNLILSFLAPWWAAGSRCAS